MMKPDKKPKPQRVWVAVDSSGFAGPWTTRRTRRECKASLINDWLGPDVYEKYGAQYRIARATLTLDPPKASRKV
jgi:hypothetical protein